MQTASPAIHWNLSHLGDLVLLLVQLELYEEFSEHIVDSVEGDVRVTKLVLGVESIPDVANGSIVLRDAVHGLDDKRNNCSRMNILSGFDTNSVDVASLRAISMLGQGWQVELLEV